MITQPCVKINNYKTDWFPTYSSIQQGGALSRTMFSLYINDLAKDLKELNMGLPYGYEQLCIHLYADDIVILHLIPLSVYFSLSISPLSPI